MAERNGSNWLRFDIGHEASAAYSGLEFFWPLTIAQSHAGAATILVDEFDARHFQRSSELRSSVVGTP